MEFNFDDQKQTINGWHPTQQDVKNSIHDYYHPDSDEMLLIKKHSIQMMTRLLTPTTNA